MSSLSTSKSSTLKKKISNLCNLNHIRANKRLRSLYQDLISPQKKSLRKKKICEKLIEYNLLNFHSNIEDRFFFISQILRGNIIITNQKIVYPLRLQWDPISKVNMLPENNYPKQILNYFTQDPDHECKFLSDSLGKMSYPFCLTFKKTNLKLSLKIGYFIQKSIKRYTLNKALITNKEKIKIQIRRKHNLSSDNPSVKQLFSQYMISENMSQIEKKVKENLNDGDLVISKDYSKKSLLNRYVELESNLPVNVENRIIYLLAELVFKKYTPHINLPIFSFRTSMSKLNLDLSLYPKIKEDLENKRILDNVSVLVSEWCSYGNLRMYLKENSFLFRNNSFYWDIIFFQLIYTLTIIQSVYPNFRHNDLHLKNILVQKTNFESSQNFLYHLTINNQDYYYVIPDIGFQIRIWDYDWSSIDKMVVNKKAVQRNRHIPNRTFDLFCCMYLLEKIYDSIMTGDLKSRHLLFFRDIKKGINKSHMSPQREQHLSVNQEFAIPENILLKHSQLNNSNGLFKKFLFSKHQIKNMSFVDSYKYP